MVDMVLLLPSKKGTAREISAAGTHRDYFVGPADAYGCRLLAAIFLPTPHLVALQSPV